jgi:hypothetical protein
VDKNIRFKAQQEIDYDRVVAFSMDTQNPGHHCELKHCGVQEKVKRNSHAHAKCLTAVPTRSVKHGREQNVFDVKVLCTGKHGPEAIPLIVFIQVAAKNDTIILRSKPFILCPGRESNYLENRYLQMKDELVKATDMLFSPVPATDQHPGANPPQPTHSPGEELDAQNQGDHYDIGDITLGSEDPFSDPTGSRFVN